MSAKSFNVSSEEIAQSYERPDGFDIRGRFGILDSLQFIFARFYSFWSKCEPQVGHLIVSEYTFLQIYFEMIHV
jgi:hypothetical protein